MLIDKAMRSHEHLTVGEFDRGLQSLERSFTRGFEGVETRFDRLDEKVDGHAERLAALESSVKARSRNAAGWSTAATAFMIAVFEAVRAYLR